MAGAGWRGPARAPNPGLAGFDNPALVCEVASHYRRCSAAEGLEDDTPAAAGTTAASAASQPGGNGSDAGRGWRASAQHLRNRVWDVASGVTHVLHERVGTLVGGSEVEGEPGLVAPPEKTTEEPPSEGAPAPWGEDPVGAPTSDPQSEEGVDGPGVEAGAVGVQEREADEGLSELHRFLATDGEDEGAEDTVEARLGVPSAYLRAARGEGGGDEEGGPRLVLTPEGGGTDAEEKQATEEDLLKRGGAAPMQGSEQEEAAPAPVWGGAARGQGGTPPSGDTTPPESPDGGGGAGTDNAWI